MTHCWKCATTHYIRMSCWNGIVLKKIEISPAEYRDAMAAIAEQVHLVSTDGGAGRRVVAATAVTSVSDEPPIVLVCLNRSVPANDVYLQNGVFAVSTLGETHLSLADACSGKTGADQAERFALAQWERRVTGSPVLVGAVASFDCEILETMEMATHRVLFGKVRSLSRGPSGRPLLYHERKYRIL